MRGIEAIETFQVDIIAADQRKRFVEAVAQLFAQLVDDEREAIASLYCRYCWTRTDGNSCHCRNDE